MRRGKKIFQVYGVLDALQNTEIPNSCNILDFSVNISVKSIEITFYLDLTQRKPSWNLPTWRN